jgi:hypothetical protein
MTTADSLPSDLVPKVPTLELGVSNPVDAVASAIAAGFNALTEIERILNSPEMIAARANVAAMKAQDQAATDADAALAGKDVTPLEDDLS